MLVRRTLKGVNNNNNNTKIGTGTGGLENKRTNGDHPNYSIIKMS